MKNISLLDCTLRDGGRIINCKFSDYEIKNIIKKITDAKINYIEVGFLRDWRKVHYVGNSTFFTSVKQIEPFLQQKCAATKYVAFVDYGMFDFDSLDIRDGKSIDGIRVGFTKKNYLNSWEDVKKSIEKVREKGYDLFIQGVNSLAYSETELINLLQEINQIKPKAFGIVDTYGAMSLNDIDRIFGLVHRNLDPSVCLDIHTHNNKQMAFALAQEVIRLVGTSREVIIDATLEGMGKCAGNLNLELITDYLIQEKKYDYDFDGILDIVDEFTFSIKKDHKWGYSIPAFMGGIYKSHPNNIIYLTEKFRLSSRDIKNILSMIDEDTRQTYNYDNIEKKYIEYSDTNINDENSLDYLRSVFFQKNVLILAPGGSIKKYKTKIDNYIAENEPLIITVNFISEYKNAYSFFGNKKRYDALPEEIIIPKKLIAMSNIKPQNGEIEISYNRLIDRHYKLFENSTIMLLNLLKIISVKSIAIAGFDGYSKHVKNNFFDESFSNYRHYSEYEFLNKELTIMLKDYIEKVRDNCKIEFLTPSIYERRIKSGKDN